jgi:hypothetical protein
MKSNNLSELVQLGILEDATFPATPGKRVKPFHDQFTLKGSLTQFVEIATRVRDLLVQRAAQPSQILIALDDLIERIEAGACGRDVVAQRTQILAQLNVGEPEFCDLHQAIDIATAVLENICNAIEVEGVAEEVANQILWCGMEFSRLLARIEVRPSRKFIESGKRQRIDHPEAMRAAKSKATAKKHKESRRQAEEALNWAKYKFPEEDFDGNSSFLKEKAAEHLGKSVRTLNRWLREK